MLMGVQSSFVSCSVLFNAFTAMVSETDSDVNRTTRSNTRISKAKPLDVKGSKPQILA